MPAINVNGKLRIKGATTGENGGGGTPTYTFKTTKISGVDFAYITTTTGYAKFNSTVYLVNDEIGYTLDNPNGEYTLVSCDEFGTPSGDITNLNFAGNNQITEFNGTGLSSLASLNLPSNQLTSFDGTGLSGLINLDLQSNQLTSFDGTGLTGLGYLYLYSNQLTSLSGFTFPPNLLELGLGQNQLESFDGTGLSTLTGLLLDSNQLTSFDASELPNLTYLELSNNLLDASDNDLILSQLDANGLENGSFMTSGGRTSTSDTAYNNLIGKNWGIFGANLI